MNSTLFKASCTWYVWATHFALLERRATVIVAAKLPISTKATAETKASFARFRGSMLIAHSHSSNSGVTFRTKTIEELEADLNDRGAAHCDSVNSRCPL